MLRVRVLGDLEIELDGTALEPPASKRARALLGWLALDRRMHTRSGLASRFWPDVLDESARTSLRSALSALRRALGPDAEPYLIATRDEVGLADDSLVWTDLAEFERCVEAGRLEEALELSRGELLAGLDDDWVYERRDEHRDRVAGVLARLAADAERDGDPARAIDYTRRQVALDQLAEEPQRELIRRLAAAGDRAGAIRAYERLSHRFREELRIVPSQATRELAEDLRRGGEAAPREVAGAPEAPATQHRVSLPPPLTLDEPAPLVGRGAELEALSRLWQGARGGRRAVAVIVGEPGIGKTRLAADFSRGAYAEGAVVLLGRCYEDSIVPYEPFVEALRHHASETPLDQLRLEVARHRPVLARLVPELADPAPESITSATGGSPEGEQFQLFDSVASLLRAIAHEHPLILVLDDLHWADSPTLLLLRYVVRATEGTPLLILGTYRQTEVDETHPLGRAMAELRRGRPLVTVALDGLAEGEVAELVASRLSGAAPAGLARSIVERTQGNPFFVEELLRDVSSDGDVGDALTRIPDSVKDLILRRLRRLDESCKRLLAIGAVSGHEFSLDVLERVAGATGEEIAERLEQAIAAHAIHESPAEVEQYGFTHTLIRETIYEQVSLARRTQLHRRIAEVIEDVLEDRADTRASSLAYHFSAAGDVRKAYHYHSQAAAADALVYAVEPALAHYSAALEAGTKLGFEPAHDPALRGLLVQRGKMRWRIGELSDARTDLEAVLAAARRAGDRAGELETLNELGLISLRSDLGAAAASHEAALQIARELGDTAAETSALDRLSVISSHLLQLDRALELGERALELARATDDQVVVGRAIDSIKLATLQLGDLPRLESLTAELEPLWQERGDLWYLQFTLLESAFVPLGAARWEAADERLAAAIAINRRFRDPLVEMMILDASCWLNRSRGAYEEALAAGRRAMALTAEVGWEGWAAATLGSTLLDLRAADHAARVLERGLAAAERIGATNETVRCLGQLAWARCLLDDQEQAGALCARARELLEGVTAPPGHTFVFGAHAYAAVARVLLASGHPEQSEELLFGVFSAAQRSGWHEAAALTGLVIGLCAQAAGEGERARERLEHAAGLADEHGIPAVGWEAHAALTHLVDEPNEHLAAAAAILERVAADLKDEELRAGLLQQATP